MDRKLKCIGAFSPLYHCPSISLIPTKMEEHHLARTSHKVLALLQLLGEETLCKWYLCPQCESPQPPQTLKHFFPTKIEEPNWWNVFLQIISLCCHQDQSKYVSISAHEDWVNVAIKTLILIPFPLCNSHKPWQNPHLSNCLHWAFEPQSSKLLFTAVELSHWF